jgi:FkbH-like protein
MSGIIESCTERSDKVLFFEQLFRSSLLDGIRVGGELLNLANRFHRIESLFIDRHLATLSEKRLAILGSFSTQHLTKVLTLYLFRRGILPRVYEASFDSIDFEILNEDSALYAFRPEILVLLMSDSVLRDLPPLFATPDQVDRWVQMTAARFEEWWWRAHAQGVRQILHPLIPAPLFRPLGTLEPNYAFSPTNLIRALNLQLVRNRPEHVTLVDLEGIASQVGKENWTDERSAVLSKQGFAMNYFGIVAGTIANLVAATVGKEKKCLVLDLDNTLWGGVIGDDGIDGIRLDPTDAIGESFLAFQRYLKRLGERGVILAVCSKNSEENARIPFEKHPNSILRMDDFALFVANWEHKVENIRAIAQRLNIGLESVVFVDDNPAEREQVRQLLPEVTVVELPDDPAGFVRALDLGGYFDWLQLSREDLARSDSYVAESRRNALLSEAADYNQYLRSLDMQVSFVPVNEESLPRFTQLINKTNQFNLRTVRYSPGSVSEAFRSDTRRLVAAHFRDRFSDFGIMSCLIVEKRDDVLFIDTWVMSCRVFKRGLEYAVMNRIVEIAAEMGCARIVGDYIPSKKNEIVSDLYSSLGFERVPGGEGASDASRFEIARERARHLDHFIRIM